jgi:hypothetical protein
VFWIKIVSSKVSKQLDKQQIIMHYKLNVKGKVVPLQAWTGPEGSRRLRLPDF